MGSPGCACSSGPPRMPSIPRTPMMPTSVAPPMPDVPIPEARPSARGSKIVAAAAAADAAAKERGSIKSGPPPQVDPMPSGEDEQLDAVSASPSAKLAELKKKWVSPLRQFDVFANATLRKLAIAEEDFPRLTVPPIKGLHKCKVSAMSYHQVDTSVEMEQDLRNIGIQQTFMLEQLEKLTKAEAACRFQGAVRAAEIAAMAAPPELAEEAAVASARGYTVDAQEFSKKVSSGENPVEIIGYIGCTRPNNF